MTLNDHHIHAQWSCMVFQRISSWPLVQLFVSEYHVVTFRCFEHEKNECLSEFFQNFSMHFYNVSSNTVTLVHLLNEQMHVHEQSF